MLTAGFAAALAVAAFAAPGSAGAATAPHPGSASTLKGALLGAHGQADVGKIAGAIPRLGTQLGAAASATAGCKEPNCNLSYHGGPVEHTPHIYVVFWGPKWTKNATEEAAANYLLAFYKGLGESKDVWSKDASQYPDKTGRPTFTGKSLLVSFATDPSTPPNPVTINSLGNEAAGAAGAFKIPLSTAADQDEVVIAAQSGTCFNTQGEIFAGNCGKSQNQGYCGFHSYDVDTANSNIYLSFTNLPFQLDAGTGCGEHFINSGAAGVFDGFSITGGHEVIESVTDPTISAWYDASDAISGGEIADKCAWGGVLWGSNDPKGNIHLNTGSFASQSLWSNVKHGCVMSGLLPLKITALANRTTKKGTAVSLQVLAHTTPATTLRYKATGLPTGLSINSKTGKITGKPTKVAIFHVKITVSYYASSGSISFTWKIIS